jgi:hypothetical protein
MTVLLSAIVAVLIAFMPAFYSDLELLQRKSSCCLRECLTM